MMDTFCNLGSQLVSEMEFEDSIQRVRNLAGHVALPTEPEPKPPHKRRSESYIPDLKWLYAGACRAMNG